MKSINSPYNAPSSDPFLNNSHMSPHIIYGSYRDPRKLAKITKIFLIIDLIVSLIYGVLNIFHYTQLGSISQQSFEELSTIDMAFLAISIIMLTTYLTTVVVFSMWTYRMMKNTWIIDKRNNFITPGWAVGWYFIPFANLWKPIEAVQQIRNTIFEDSNKARLAPWWTFWILSSITGRISMQMKVDTIDQAQASAMFDALTSPIDILVCIFAFLMVKKLTDRQYEVYKTSTVESG